MYGHSPHCGRLLDNCSVVTNPSRIPSLFPILNKLKLSACSISSRDAATKTDRDVHELTLRLWWLMSGLATKLATMSRPACGVNVHSHTNILCYKARCGGGGGFTGAFVKGSYVLVAAHALTCSRSVAGEGKTGKQTTPVDTHRRGCSGSRHGTHTRSAPVLSPSSRESCSGGEASRCFCGYSDSCRSTCRWRNRAK